jgi:hypothetical protein
MEQDSHIFEHEKSRAESSCKLPMPMRKVSGLLRARESSKTVPSLTARGKKIDVRAKDPTFNFPM